MDNIRQIGELLKNTRQKKGLTIEKIYKKTHIYPGVIKSLEEGTTESLSNKIYAKAFLKKYVAFLGLDVKAITGQYEKLFPDKDEQKFYIDKDQPSSDMIKPLNIYLSIVVIIIFFIFTIITISKIKLFIANKIKRTQEAPVSEGPLYKKEDTKIAPMKELAPIPKSSDIFLMVNSSEDVWLRVKKDGEIVFTGILPGGKQESWVGKERIELRAGKLEAIDFTVNKKNIGRIGSGVKDVIIDKEGIKIEKKKIKIP